MSDYRPESHLLKEASPFNPNALLFLERIRLKLDIEFHDS
jgi:hypothetical protein